jgi:hypothetical protein
MTHVTIAPHVLVRNIHQRAWKGNSANFALLDFYTLHTRTNSWLDEYSLAT